MGDNTLNTRQTIVTASENAWCERWCKAIEDAVDDMVWSRDCEDRVFRERFMARFNDIPWYSELGSAYSTGVSYTGRICQHALTKATEHRNIATKLKNIQACLGDVGMRASLEPLVIHHQQISNSYMAIHAFYV